ncbi:cytochrome c (plasmid) [Aliiroseovarius crassostreae]|uniref:Cytochrome c n=1 Tax=Aliiroseovarius crassostreae TaxID=154981 RepID=A0A9Q9LWL5_9RHOB|nr:cytochrome c [Aliiroseovarius crassostreae]UWP93904.1 cytochrome c [Aliiroseovarius crassostreae]UWP97051.1 cytochrome c [Aliiroseovarius crassostreae]UWQ00237.1 cytochrome c [Aliiroseovarius crassostreae]
MSKSGLFVGGVLLAGVAVAVWQFMQPAPVSQGHSMAPPDTSRIAEGAPIAEVRVPAELSAEAEIGKRVFEAKCAACHGENAAGQNGVAPPLVHKIYEPSHHSDMAFILAAKNGVRAHHWKFGNMPPVEGLTQGDVKYIARYVRELQRENGIN